MLLLNKTLITEQLKNPDIEILIHDRIDSTNLFLQHYQPTHPITICLAEQQTAGKGRMLREWYSPFGENIYFSCLYPWPKSSAELSGLSLVIGLTVYKTLRSFGIDERLGVKWPNDVLYENKKIAGVLVEIQQKTNRIIIGIGINVNMESDENHISQDWISMQKILATELNRNDICVALTKNLLSDLSQFESQGFVGFVEIWNQLNSLHHKIIHLKHQHETVVGRMLGVNIQGEMLLELADGSIKSYAAGELCYK